MKESSFAYIGSQTCIVIKHSSSEVVLQSLHITNGFSVRSVTELQEKTLYVW